MTVLASYADRQVLGIDTFERALLYSAILLNKANTDPNNFVNESDNPNTDAVQITFNLNDSRISQLKLADNFNTLLT